MTTTDMVNQGLWFIGVIVTIRPMMRREMLKKVCSECDHVWVCDHKYGSKVVRGSKFPRDGYHVFLALWNAVCWPAWLPLVVAWTALRMVARGLYWGINALTPLTGPELERVIEERGRSIEALTREVNDYVTPSEMRVRADLPGQGWMEGELCRPTPPEMFCPVCTHARDLHSSTVSSSQPVINCAGCASTRCATLNGHSAHWVRVKYWFDMGAR